VFEKCGKELRMIKLKYEMTKSKRLAIRKKEMTGSDRRKKQKKAQLHINI
jgi:hypothetical protein